jgi:60 kDa SS-A/Ro ribonucleoprotein
VADEENRAGIGNVEAGRLVPINFVASARHNPRFEPELEAKFFECFAGREKVGGMTVILIDVSGSMDALLFAKSEMKRIDVACSLAMIERETFYDLKMFTLLSSLVEVPGRRGLALRDALTGSQPHGGTELGNAISSLPASDRLIVITDEQSHDKMPQRKGCLINVASAQNGVGYGQWVNIDGWSDQVLDYIIKYEASD